MCDDLGFQESLRDDVCYKLHEKFLRAFQRLSSFPQSIHPAMVNVMDAQKDNVSTDMHLRRRESPVL